MKNLLSIRYIWRTAVVFSFLSFAWLLVAGRNSALLQQPADYIRCIRADISKPESISKRFWYARITTRTFWRCLSVRVNEDGTSWSGLPRYKTNDAIPVPDDKAGGVAISL